MVARLVGPDYGGRKVAMIQTVEADLLDSDQSDDSLALCGSWQSTSGADVSSKQVVAHFCLSDLAMSVLSLLLVDALQTGSDPASPASPGCHLHHLLLSLIFSKAWSSLDPSGYSPKSDTSSSSTLCHTNPMPVLPTDILVKPNRPHLHTRDAGVPQLPHPERG